MNDLNQLNKFWTSCSIINKKGMHIQQIMVYLTIKLDKKPIILTYGQFDHFIWILDKWIWTCPTWL